MFTITVESYLKTQPTGSNYNLFLQLNNLEYFTWLIIKDSNQTH